MRLEADRRAFRIGFSPLFIGLHWPSQPWGEEALATAVSFATAGASAIAPLVEAAVQHFGGGDAQEAAREKSAYERDPPRACFPTTCWRVRGARCGNRLFGLPTRRRAG